MKNRIITIAVQVAGWILFLSLPILFTPALPTSAKQEFGGFYFMPVVLTSLILIGIFYLNYAVLIPNFLFKGRYFVYTALCIACIVSMLILPTLAMRIFHEPNRAIMDDPSFKNAIPLVFVNSLLMFITVFFASIGLRMNNRWKQTEKERLIAHIAHLKTKINPHFLFNTLNNIYSVTIDKAPRGADMVQKLSEMMRYVLKEAQLDLVPLDDEIFYIMNYVDLQKVRFDNSVKFSIKIEGDSSQNQIAPLLLIPFIENAFKHGINSEQDSNIRIILSIANNELHLTVGNNIVQVENTSEERSGLGIENTKNRLQLLYPNKHLLTISENGTRFYVSLHINLK